MNRGIIYFSKQRRNELKIIWKEKKWRNWNPLKSEQDHLRPCLELFSFGFSNRNREIRPLIVPLVSLFYHNNNNNGHILKSFHSTMWWPQCTIRVIYCFAEIMSGGPYYVIDLKNLHESNNYEILSGKKLPVWNRSYPGRVWFEIGFKMCH